MGDIRMKDKPILFSGPMIRALLARALLAGRKTQTRRVLDQRQFHGDCAEVCTYSDIDNTLIQRNGYDGSICGKVEVKYTSGDRLWVREAYRTVKDYDHLPPSKLPAGAPVFYEIDHDYCDRLGRYRHARFMPRWASRLTLVVTDVRVQRLQDISEEDAKAEGCEPTLFLEEMVGGHPAMYRRSFALLWDSIHAKRGYGWNANPWVVALTFEARQCNVKDLE